MSKKKKKVTVYKMPKAQDGMQMAEQAPQQQGGGQDQMQQLAQQVQQMLEQGADPAQVVAQLVQGGVPPQAVAQILVSLGMPEEQVMPMIEQVMQQMQGVQQQAPPQEGMTPEGQPMMPNGDEVKNPVKKELLQTAFSKRLSSLNKPEMDYTGPVVSVKEDNSLRDVLQAAANVPDKTTVITTEPKFKTAEEFGTIIKDREFAEKATEKLMNDPAGHIALPDYDADTVRLYYGQNAYTKDYPGLKGMMSSGYFPSVSTALKIPGAVYHPGEYTDSDSTYYDIILNRDIKKGDRLYAMGGESQAGQMEQMVSQIAKELQGGANPQEVIEQLLQSTGDPNAVLQLMAAATGADEQTAMEQIAPMVEQVASQMQGGSPQQAMKGGGMVPKGYHRMPDGSIMADSAHMDDGGQVDELMMGAINPTKEDFMSLKKKMLKSMKNGGTTTAFDTSDTAAYVQNLHGAVANHVAKNLRVGMINQQFDKVMQGFDSLPKAEGGMEFLQNQQQQKTDEMARSLNVRNSALYDPNPEMRISEESINQGESDNTVQQQINSNRHYYPGHGPGQRSLGGKYYANRFDKSPLGQLFGASSVQGTGNYNLIGTGELEGAGMQAINDKMAEIAANPEGYGFRTTKGYLNRRGKLKKRPGLFGRPGAVQFDYVGKGVPTTNGESVDAETKEQVVDPNAPKAATEEQLVAEQELAQGVQQFDKYGNPYFSEAPEGTTLYTDPLTGEQMSMAPRPTPIIDERGRIRTSNEVGGYAEGESELMAQYINEGMNPRRAARKAKQEIAKQNPEVTGVTYSDITPSELGAAFRTDEFRQLEPDEKKAENLIKKYGAENIYTGPYTTNVPQETLDYLSTGYTGFNRPMSNEELQWELENKPQGIQDAINAGRIITDEQGNMYQKEIANERSVNYDPARGFYQYGGSVSQPGRMAVNFGQVRNTNHPTHALFRAFNGLETKPVELLDERPLNGELMGYGSQGNTVPMGEQSGFRISEDMERTTDYGAIGQGIYDVADWATNYAQGIKDTPSTAQAQADLQKRVPVYDPGSGSLGFYNQFGDARFSRSGNLGAPQRAGTGSDPEATRFTPGSNYQTAMGWGDANPMFVKNGGMIMAQLGLQVGDEVELSENEILELAKYGYEITRM